MKNDNVYKAAAKIYGLYGAFFKQVAGEIGTERALALHQKANKAQGLVSGAVLRNNWGSRPLDIQGIGTVLKESNQSIGIESEIKSSSPSSVLFANARCPMYDGYRNGGLDDQTAEALCQKGAAAKLGTMLQCLDPHINYRLTHYRSNPCQRCEEEIFRNLK
jgi:hypothetical protein